MSASFPRKQTPLHVPACSCIVCRLESMRFISSSRKTSLEPLYWRELVYEWVKSLSFMTCFLVYRRSIEYIHKVILLYTHILMCQDRCDGTLRGCILVKIEHKANYTQIELGWTIFKTHYRGSPFLKITLSSLILSEIHMKN